MEQTELLVCSIGVFLVGSETQLPIAFLREVFGTELKFTNENIKIADYRAMVETLIKENDPIGWFLAAYFACRDTKYDEENRKTKKMDLIKILSSAKMEETIKSIVYTIIDGLLNLLPELQDDFDLELEKFEGEKSMEFITQSGLKWFMKGEEKGKADGEARGKARGKAEGLALALKLKYGEPGSKFAKKLIGIDNLEILDSIYQGIEADLPLSELKKLLKPTKASIK